ncbi:GNAT family N-acetyltransferase [Deinococcus sp. JMULE3]|uniref:GNAT family N-acetyltransferase n=1 Tax=Deinococcus sp. JMULE3 TaxID=2518341 RepID=UPI0015775F1D|nr:GNAT family N-acetyltransferase [Deinococcus sp. JMULE3]NTY02387.1 GNAT family N-acetyltransferase [Deinococcus sp. JMULE3]
MTEREITQETHRLLTAYDTQLREVAELIGATTVTRDGPLWRGTYGDRGFVTYRDLGALTGPDLDSLIARTITYYATQPEITTFEWKTRGHDLPADLPDRLTQYGLHAEDPETVMLGEASLLAAPMPLPAGVNLRRIDTQPDPMPDLIRAAAAQERAFGVPFSTADLARRLQARRDLMEIWVAEADGEIICTGRLELIPGTAFAGIWGGGTVPEWRGKGIYRALVAQRAQSALARGVRYLHSDSTEFSRPILQRSGLVPVTTTTPFIWTRRS